MRAKLLLVLLPALMLTACGGVDLMSSSQISEPETTSSETISEPAKENKLVVDNTNLGGANLPISPDWNDSDTSSTVRKGTYSIGDSSFSLEFVGKWCAHTKYGELQTKKDPQSYVRSASDLVITKMVVEVFQADFEVFLTKDHSGTKLTGKKVDAIHSDGDAYSFDINSADWSILATETYKGGNINFYSFTFYF